MTGQDYYAIYFQARKSVLYNPPLWREIVVALGGVAWALLALRVALQVLLGV